MKNRSEWLSLFFRLPIVLLLGCQGDPPPPPTTTLPTQTYLFYEGSLIAVDPANPATSTIVESQTIEGANSLFWFVYDPASRRFSDAHMYVVVYAKGGKLYKVSALKSSGHPISVQISNETQATKICNNDYELDLVDSNNSQYLYNLPGPDGDCATSDDNLLKMIKVGMTATDSPIPAKKPVREIADRNGALVGWLVIDGKVLNHYDTNFQNPIQVTTFTNSARSISWEMGNIFLAVDDKMYRYNAITKGLSNPLHTFSPIFSGGAWDDDGVFLYFVDGKSIYKVPLDGSGSSTLLVSENTTISSCCDITANKVIYTVNTGGTAGTTLIKSIHKTGGTPMTLDTVSGFVYPFTTAGGLIYYNYPDHSSFSSSTSSSTAKVVDESGAILATHLNARWVGLSFPTSGSFDSFTPKYIILAEGVVGSNMASSTLKSFDALSHAHQATLGTVPPDIRDFHAFGLGGTFLAGGENASSTSDIFFVDVGTNNSLLRLTNTPAIDEVPLDF